MTLNWVPGQGYTQADTDTHRFRITDTAFEGGRLQVWAFDDNAPYGLKLLHTCDRNSVAGAKREAQSVADNL
jgi:hypothetical protein